MAARRKQLLDSIRPGAGTQDAQRWQQVKSSQTRQGILDAAMMILVEGGYARLTTVRITQDAGISRGAMHHHFANRDELIAALVDHVLYRRMRHFLDEYLRDIAALPKESALAIATELYWRSVQSDEYAAYLELALAARSDTALRSVFIPAAKRFDAIWNDEMVHSFPNWSHIHEQMRLTNDIVQSACLGMLLHEPVVGEARTREQRALLIEIVRRVHGGLRGKQAELPDLL
ncbi:TetR/AcrR family transcriptional regulator [Croceicoccus sp. YJ47]|uniref:TetR/AcrR family transcriptional regulator n=1 Tax=Croceicoccus sp. YJ47 TaxID=2798724 RepID=UPI0019231CBE|nr:TetR/AcrR family transcriptional regulator [Croceicoccus sp. YJ47]QQN73419.1 TetR/AcrR family transcriptional regulator [Croceicoccus sp. YJ47]